jgi:D-glycero-D-manno-heptose 1,7-bisphosphate phosphatase
VTPIIPGSDGRRAVFLDRDGVLNEPLVRGGKPYPPPNLEAFRLLPDVERACDRLSRDGLTLVVVTNQPDIARGTQDPAVVDEMHRALLQSLPVEAVYVCPHDDSDGCDCRKPAPGLLLEAASDLHLDLSGSVMVGDRWRDVAAGRRAGCLTVFVDRGYDERRPTDADAVVADLAGAAEWILARSGKRSQGPTG